MKDIGHPIIGDKKYGSKKDLYKRMTLHAYELELIHPITKKKMVFAAKIPNCFNDFKKI